MADFEGLQLISTGEIGGAVLMLNKASDVSGIAHLPEGVEVEVHRGISAVVVRGIDASNYQSIIAAAPEQANRALDIFAMTGRAKLALADVWSNHVAWWSTPDASVVRIWCSSTLMLTVQAEGTVSGPDGVVRRDIPEAPPPWHESMRYFRMSEITDDLFDAFRNIYLALESLLNKLEPRRSGEGEGVWLKRALQAVGNRIELRAYLPITTDEPANRIYVELWKEIRNYVFHAKSASASFLPQDLPGRDKVANAKSRYTNMYLDLARLAFGGWFPSGGLSLSHSATREATTAMTKGWQISFGADPYLSEGPEEDASWEWAKSTTLQTERCEDPRGDNFSAVIASVPVPKMGDSTVIGRIFTFTADGQQAFAQSFDSRVNVNGFDLCEFVVSVSVAGRQHRKTIYAT